MPDPTEILPQLRFSDLVAAAIKPVPINLGNLVAPEMVDGWRAQLLKGHEQALQGVAGSLSRTITDLNLAGLAAAAVPSGLIGSGLQQTIKELTATYTTGIGAQVRDIVISGIRPAALAASATMMERLKASSEVQRTYDDALRRMGWWLPPSVSMSFFCEVGRLADERKRVDVRWAMADYAKSREFGRSVERWMDLDVFKDRRRFIRDGLRDHRNGRYRVSIPTLLPPGFSNEGAVAGATTTGRLTMTGCHTRCVRSMARCGVLPGGSPPLHGLGSRLSVRPATKGGEMAARIALVLVVAVVLAACGPASPTATPSSGAASLPSAQASGEASQSAPPSASPPSQAPQSTPSATPTAAVTPAPAGPLDASTFLADLKAGGTALTKYRTPKITRAEFQAAFDALMATPAKPGNQYFPEMFADCASPTADRDTLLAECMSVTNWAFRAVQDHRDSAEAEALALATARWDVGHVYTSASDLGLLTQGMADIIANF